MKFLNVIFILLIYACSTRSQIKNPFYYEARKGDRIVHILGTMHVGFELSDLHPVIKKHMEEAELVALEFDAELLKYVRTETTKRFAKYAAEHELKPYPELQEKLSSDAWKELLFTLRMDAVRNTLAKTGINLPVTQLHPILVRALVVDLMHRQQWYAFSDVVKERSTQQGFLWVAHDLRSKLDLEILQFAEKKEIPVMALDSASDTYLESMINFERNAIQYLEMIFGDNSSRLKEYYLLRDHYQSGNELKLVELLSKAPEVKELRLLERNEEWVPKIKWRVERNIFLAVGAGHLVGNKSFLELLEKEGFEIRKISLK